METIAIEDESQLYRLQGSKYVQANVGNTYAQAKAFLDAGVKKEEIASELKMIKEHLQTDFTKLNEKELKQLSENIKKAEN